MNKSNFCESCGRPTSQPEVCYFCADKLRVTVDTSEMTLAQAGLVLRLAIATGAHLGLHYLGEGERTNYATAKEMGEPTARFFSDRQEQLIWMIEDLVSLLLNNPGNHCEFFQFRCQIGGDHFQFGLHTILDLGKKVPVFFDC